MTGRTHRHVIVARRYQGLAGEADGYASPGTGSRSCEPSIIVTRHRSPHLILAVALLLAMAGDAVGASPINSCLETIKTPTPVTAVHIQPDSGAQPILDEINNARCTIDLSMYLLTAQEILDALEGAVDRGIRVRVILEQEPFGTFGTQQEMFDRLTGIGAEVRWGADAFVFSHAKYMIIDTSVLVVTNQNFTGAGFNSNREFGLVTTEGGYVSEAVAIFEADWTGSDIGIEPRHLVVSPLNSRSTILSLINGSTESVWMYSEVLRDEEITAALSAAADRGVDVRILVNPSADEEDVPYFLEALGHGVQIRVLRVPYVHSKVIIVDGQEALVGSQNYSFTSLDLNREVGIVIDDAHNVDKILAIYERDWSRAEPVDTVSRVRNTLVANRLDSNGHDW